MNRIPSLALWGHCAHVNLCSDSRRLFYVLTFSLSSFGGVQSLSSWTRPGRGCQQEISVGRRISDCTVLATGHAERELGRHGQGGGDTSTGRRVMGKERLFETHSMGFL